MPMTGRARTPDQLLDHQGAVNSALRELMERSASSGLPLYRMMQYQLGWVDKDGQLEIGPPPDRFYGALCAEAAASWGAPADARPAIAAAELLAQSIVVHEEMQLGEHHLEHRPAVWWVWGPAQAINVGDGLHALARLSAFRLKEAGLAAERTLGAVVALDAAALRYYEGQFMDLTYQERLDVTEAQYARMAASKRGALVGGTIALGAYVAGATDEQIQAAWRFGELAGSAMQMREDVTLLWHEGDGRSGRVLNKSKLLPVVYALDHATIAQKRALGDVYFKRVMEPDDVRKVRAILDQIGARDYTQERAEATAREAMASLDRAGVSAQARERWDAIIDTLTKG
ncbi:MAG: hypothetical protein FJ318_04070 [SAR202 cluster bacterium]|nr:hypothetical protein [SAR202 cluster bacterium]